jgi:proton-dependent oligopeptide transporter, POT family
MSNEPTQKHSERYLTSPVISEKMPSGIPYIIGNEIAERFSFYGMRAILAVFLTNHLLNSQGVLAPMDDNTANVWQHNFVAAVYFLPLFGAILADWLLGKYRTILFLSLFYCLGHAVMALVDYPAMTGLNPRLTLGIALGLIAIGAGGIKPCVSAHVGDQFGPKNQHLLSNVYSWFYFSINFGSTFSTLLTPWLLEHYGPGVAFGVPGVLMAIATFMFWLGRHKFVHIPPGGKNFFKESISKDGLLAIANLAPLYFMLAPFWALFDQTQSSWVHQARDLNCNVFGYEILPAQIQAANPILVMIFIPIFTYWLYPAINKFWELTPLRKIGIGFLLSGPAFAVVAWTQMRIDAGETPHLIWQLLAYVLMTAAEVMVSITSLEFSYTQAPKKMKSFIMGVYFLSITLGNVFTSEVNSYIKNQRDQGNPVLEGADYFWFFTWVMVATTVVYIAWSSFYKGKTYIQGEEISV